MILIQIQSIITLWPSRQSTRQAHSVSGEAAGNATTVVQQHRERLAALAAGVRARQYLGKTLSIDQIDNLEDEEVEKLYGRYEARLGAAMTKPLGAAVLQLYTSTVSIFLPIPPRSSRSCSQNLSLIPSLSTWSAMLCASSITSLEWYLPR